MTNRGVFFQVKNVFPDTVKTELQKKLLLFITNLEFKRPVSARRKPEMLLKEIDKLLKDAPSENIPETIFNRMIESSFFV